MPEGSPFSLLVVVSHGVHAACWGFEENVWLNFLGISYRANIWVNGRKVADANDVAGTISLYEFDGS